MDKLNVVFGTAGHIDHGKTTLLKALTGIDADRLVLEKELGITIDIGFAPWITDEVNMGFVDVPGHEKYVRNMVVGVSGIDGVLLVVAANEGIMLQTIEHIDICSMLDIKKLVVALTKIDMVSSEDVKNREKEISDFLKGYSFNVIDIVKTSGITGEGIDSLKKALLKMAKSVERVDENGFPRLNIDRVFKLKGIGVVVTGTTLSGSFKVGDVVEILPIHKKCKIRNIQVYEKDVKIAFSGQRTALNLSGINYEDLKRGYSVTIPDAFEGSQMVNVKIKCSKNFDKGIKDGLKVHFYAGTDASVGKVYLPEGISYIKPGEESYSQIRLEKPIFMLPCDRFIIRQYSPEITIGGGKIVEILTSKLRKKELLDRIDVFCKFESCSIPEFILLKFKNSVFTPHLVFKNLGKSIESIEEGIKNLLRDEKIKAFTFSGKTYYIELNFYRILKNKIEDILLKKGRKGIKRENLNFEIKIRDELLFNFLLESLLMEGILVKRKDLLFHRKFFEGKVDKNYIDVENFIKRRRFDGVTKEELAKKFGKKGEEYLNVLISNGKVFPVEKNYFLSEKVIEELTEKIKDKFGDKGEFSVREFKNLTGLTRKRAIPLLEFLDRKGITLRLGNVRKLRI